MAESKKAASSPANQKDKSSLLDEEIGNDFLSSWKSMSVMEDDGMDFSFDAVPKGKKKAFDFDKLDMDFDLDGDFNKISSFKVDMSDLDFSSPPRKAAKTKERSEEEPSTGNRQGKQDHFKFSFDFNELDNFDFDSSLTKSKKSSKNNQDCNKQVVSDKAESGSSKACLTAEIHSLDGDSERMATSKVDSLVVVPGNFNSVNDNCASKSDTSQNLEMPHGPRSPEKEMTQTVEERDQLCHSPEKPIPPIPTEPHAKQATKEMTKCADESGQESHLPEKAMPKEPYAKQATKEMTKCVQESGQQSHLSEKAVDTELYAKQETHGLPEHHVGGFDSTGNTGHEGKNERCPQITEVNSISCGNEDVNDKMSTGDILNHEESLLKNSSPPNITSSGSNNGHRSTSGCEVLEIEAETAIENLDREHNSNTFVSRKAPTSIKSIKEDQHSTLETPFTIQGSESKVDKGKLTTESRTGEFHLNISKRLEEAGSQLSQASSRGGTSLSSGIKRIDTMHLRPAIEQGVGDNANEAQSEGKLFNTPVLTDIETKFKHVVPGRAGFNSDGVPNRQLVGNSQLCDKKVTGREPVHGSEQRRNLNDLRPLEMSCSQPSPSSSTKKTTKPSTQTCVNSKRVLSSLESMRNTKIITAVGNKVCPDKPAKKKTDISTWNISKNTGGNKVSLNTAPRKEVKSLSSEQNMEVKGYVELQTAQIGDRSEKHMPPNHSLKRKTFEGSHSNLASLQPLKRFSQSPREIRDVKEASKGVVEEQACIHVDHSESMSQSTSYDHPTSGLGSPCQVNVMKLEIPSVMENDGNVKKAEAYAKELEDICNMLKKKHEEAKEMLVRAVMNNNNLLMLNHPIYEAKFQKVQKFAAKLLSKEIQTCSRSPTIVM